jgi:glycosyltransferase involved in cell wall biosynthesis
LKVAVVFHKLEPEAGGGSTMSRTLVEALRDVQEDRHEFIFYTVMGTLPGIADFRQIPTRRWHRWKNRTLRVIRTAQDFIRTPRWGFRTWFERSLEEEGVEFVWFASNYAEECDLPYMITMLDLAHREEPWFPEVSAGGEWERREFHFARFVRRATAIIAPNEAGAEQLERYFSVRRERILCLNHPTPSFALGCVDSPLSPGVLQRHGIELPYLFYPAQFWPHKNHNGLFATLAELNRRPGHRYTAVCVGSDHGNLAHVRRSADQLGVSERVRFLGFVNSSDLVSLYRQAHALLYLSFLGPENLPPLEAFALGCPVVAADVAGAREQMGSAAILVPPTDPIAAADAVVRLQGENLRKRLVEDGRRRAEHQSASAYVQGVTEFLDEFEPIRRSWA